MTITYFAELDTAEIQRAIDKILEERFGEGGAFVTRLFLEYCVYKLNSDGKLYKATYTASGANVKLSEKPVEVQEQTELVKVKEAKFNATPGIILDQNSVLFSEAAEQRASDKNISFGDAGRELRSEGWIPPRRG